MQVVVAQWFSRLASKKWTDLSFCFNIHTKDELSQVKKTGLCSNFKWEFLLSSTDNN